MTLAQWIRWFKEQGIKDTDVIYSIDVFIETDVPTMQAADIGNIELDVNMDGHISICN